MVARRVACLRAIVAPRSARPAFCLRSFDWPDQRAKSAPLWNKLMQQIQPLGAENVREQGDAREITAGRHRPATSLSPTGPSPHSAPF